MECELKSKRYYPTVSPSKLNKLEVQTLDPTFPPMLVSSDLVTSGLRHVASCGQVVRKLLLGNSNKDANVDVAVGPNVKEVKLHD